MYSYSTRLPLCEILREGTGEGYCWYDMTYSGSAVGLFRYIHSNPPGKSAAILRSVLRALDEQLYRPTARPADPEKIEEYLNKKMDANLEKILRSLLREGIPIKDLSTILETIVDAGSTTRDMDMITEQVRGALSRTITRKFCENGQLRVVTLDAELEKKVLAALTKNEHGVYLALSPDIVQQIVQQVGELRKKFEELSQTPILLTSQIIRVYLSRMLATFYPDIYVLSFNAITSNVQIQAIGNITLQPQEKRA
mgnify:CR=1 FL=1